MKKQLKLGILRESKLPPDKRAPLTPVQCEQLSKEYPFLQIYVQPYPQRCFADKEYQNAGLKLEEDLSSCDILIGIKEVQVPNLISGKKYFIQRTIGYCIKWLCFRIFSHYLRAGSVFDY